MTALRSSARTARHWTAVHVRRHVPFALFTTATAAYVAWVIWMMIRRG